MFFSADAIVLHLFGDYITQTDKMAKTKTASWLWAIIHAIVYTLPFMLLTMSLPALLIIFASHAVIDRYRLVRYLIFAKNWVSDRGMKWSECSGTGFHSSAPPWLAFWLMIIVDNTCHIIINQLCINLL